jgi:hypothetical protein
MIQSIGIFAGATYIIVLISVNLVGYAVGVGGVAHILGKLTSVGGLRILAISYYFLILAVAFMSYLKKLGISK